jgi:hypothetical protein
MLMRGKSRAQLNFGVILNSCYLLGNAVSEHKNIIKKFNRGMVYEALKKLHISTIHSTFNQRI